ncbi:MAG: hypothetical protein HPY66_0095 [Firmicutes bacterium]|nr:hypothetical protein [Bacillota bacterium]
MIIISHEFLKFCHMLWFEKPKHSFNPSIISEIIPVFVLLSSILRHIQTIILHENFNSKF